ncbi:MAG: N-acetylmuramoyl-L-alanine amidase [Firmicutes bacterium]|nr:N-acetylmuramoyl-L-alanine amidase [Bacillota bacterium]
MKICIDPGHGGKDPGAVSGGQAEKDIVLKISLTLANILKEKGLEVFMTRESDIYESVDIKALKANVSKSDLFVSIHCNSAASERAEGTECLIYSYDNKNDALAGNIQKNIVDDMKTSDRGLKVRRDLAVLNSTKMTAVLVETAFISNSSDRKKLTEQPHEFAKAIAKGIFEYINIEFGDDDMAEKMYNSMEEVPEWSKATVQKLIDRELIKGNDKGELELTYSMLRMLVINDRAGLYK